MAEASDLSGKVTEDAVPITVPSADPGGGDTVQMRPSGTPASYYRPAPIFGNSLQASAQRQLHSSQPQTSILHFPQQAPGGPQRSIGRTQESQPDNSLLTQQLQDSQGQARSAQQRIRAGNSHLSQSPSAKGFPELSSSLCSSSPVGLQAKSGRSPDNDDYQRDILKGVSQAVNSALSDEGYASHCDPQKPTPSSSCEEFSSMSIVPIETDDTDEDIEKYRHKLPKELKIDFYDAMILYQDDDKQDVERFLQRVNTEVLLLKTHKPYLVLYDEILPDSGMTPIGQLDLVLPYCTYVLLYVTKEFCTDAWSEFSSQTCLMDAIDNPDRRWSVVPIFTEPKRSRTFRIPPSIRSLKGIQYWSEDRFYVDSLRKLLEDKVNIRLENEKKHKLDRQIWIRQEKGREMRKADEERQRQLHAEEAEKSKTEKHHQVMLARQQAFQQRQEEDCRKHQQKMENAAEAFRDYTQQFSGQPRQESQWQKKQLQLETPEEFLKTYGDQYLPQRDDPYMQYMQTWHLRGPDPHTYFSSRLPPKPGSVPASLDQYSKVGYPAPPALLHTFSVPSGVVSSSFAGGCLPSQDPGKISSGSPDQLASKQTAWPSSSMNVQSYSGHHGFSEVGSPQVASLYEGLPSPSKSVGDSWSMPLSGSGGRNTFLEQADEPNRTFQSMPSVITLSQQSASAAQVEKGAGTVKVVQKHMADVSLKEDKTSDKRIMGDESVQSVLDSSHSEQGEKSDLVGDNPPDSYPVQGQGCSGHPPVERLRHVGQPALIESVGEPPLGVRGPAHQADSKSPAELAGREGPQRAGPQSPVAGFGVGRFVPDVQQPQPYLQRHPYPLQPRHLGFQQPGYNPYIQQHVHQHHGSHPHARPCAEGHSPADYSSHLTYPPPYYAGYQGEQRPRWQQPPPRPHQLLPHSYPGQQPSTVVHYHYHDRSEAASGTTINYIKKVDQLMMGNEVNVREKKSRSSREHGESFRSEVVGHPPGEEPNAAYEVEHAEPISGEIPTSMQPESRLAQLADQNTPSRFTDTLTADRSRVSSVSSGHHHLEEQQYASGFRDLPTSHPQPHDLQSSLPSCEASTLRQQGLGVEQWHQQYEQVQETDLKRYIVGPSEDESMRVDDDADCGTDLKSKGAPP